MRTLLHHVHDASTGVCILLLRGSCRAFRSEIHPAVVPVGAFRLETAREQALELPTLKLSSVSGVSIPHEAAGASFVHRRRAALSDSSWMSEVRLRSHAPLSVWLTLRSVMVMRFFFTTTLLSDGTISCQLRSLLPPRKSHSISKKARAFSEETFSSSEQACERRTGPSQTCTSRGCTSRECHR